MENYNKLWRSFFLIGVIAIAVQQLICADFRPVILPAGFPAWLSHRVVWTWIFSIALIITSLLMLVGIGARTKSLLWGGILLLLVILCQIPSVLTGVNSAKHLGLWIDPFKELTLSGGFFVVAGSLSGESNLGLIKFLEKLIPAGKYFLAITMVVFGYSHFVYTDFVVTLVPNWIPGHLFWTYFSAVALMLSGLAIILNIQRRTAAALLGIMLFLWVIILHIPRGIADPHSGNGNEWTSVFEALAFSGIAFLVAGKPKKAV
ncbi:MAG TPA: hypothetical protein VK668_06350 [Mucilaginibacter sp.]|nr:hypothetical protein [Mucilaginibacter sp.]